MGLGSLEMGLAWFLWVNIDVLKITRIFNNMNLQEALEQLKMDILKALRIPEIVEWLSKVLGR